MNNKLQKIEKSGISLILNKTHQTSVLVHKHIDKSTHTYINTYNAIYILYQHQNAT